MEEEILEEEIMVQIQEEAQEMEITTLEEVEIQEMEEEILEEEIMVQEWQFNQQIDSELEILEEVQD